MSEQESPRYNISIEQAVGPVIGDHANVVQNFYPVAPSTTLPSPDELIELIRQSGAEFELLNDHIASIRLERAEVGQIVNWAMTADPQQRLGMLLDQAGGGKSIVMRHVRQRLLEEGLPVLAIKADALPDVRSREDLRRWLKLALPIEDCVRQLATSRPVAVLIDQLDALSLVLSRDRATLDVVLDTIARLHTLEGVRVIASCRTFDLRNDPRLSAITIDQEFRLQPLSDRQVNQVLSKLGVNIDQLLPDHRHLLTVPLHLSIYGLIIGETKPQVIDRFYSLQELYAALWQKQIAATLPDSPSPVERRDAVYKLVDAMQNRRETKAPIAILDDCPEAANYLEAVGLIRQEHSSWHFFHQTLFDYCYARRFVARDRSLSQEVLNSAQGLFERSQIVQVLAHLRGTSQIQYQRELNSLLFGDRLRTHLRLLVLGWFGSLRGPTAEELNTARRLINSIDYRRHFLGAIGGNEAWFDLLNVESISPLLRTQDDEQIDQVVTYLSTLIQLRPHAVLAQLRPFLSQSEAWDSRIAACLSRLNTWQSEEEVDILCDMLRRGAMRGHEEFVLHDLARSNPRAACRALRVLLDYRLDGLLSQPQNSRQATIESSDTQPTPLSRFSWDQVLFGRHAVKEVLAQGVQTCPDQVLENLLPWFVRAANATLTTPGNSEENYPSDSLFSWGWYGGHIMEGAAFARQMVTALQQLAKNQRADFRITATALLQVELMAVQRVLAHAYLVDPETYVDDIFNLLTTDKRRLNLGDTEDPHYDSWRLFSAALRYSSPERRLILEQMILDHQPAWEKQALGRQGITQLRFLKSAPPELLSEKARRMLQELEHRFPGFELRIPRGVTGGAVGPPIERNAMDKMSNEAWLGAMRKYNDTTEWGAPREDFLTGGVVELSRAFAEKIKSEPERFYQMAFQFPDDISAYYVAAAISGLAESDSPVVWTFDLVRRHARRLDGEHRRSVMWALEKRAKEGVPDDILDLLEAWALNDPDPDGESWQTQVPASEQPYSNGDPHHYGINSNRGAAVRAVCYCALAREPAQVERAFLLLDRACVDSSTSVRSCVIEYLLSLLQHDYERVITIFDQTMAGHPALLQCQVTQRFLWHTYRQQFPWTRGYIEQMLIHSDRGTRDYGAVLACLSAFYIPEAVPLAEQAIAGDDALRHGAARVYATNLNDADCEEDCLTYLQILINDPDETVREQVGQCFSNARPDQIERLKPFITLFLNSPALLAGSHYLVEYLRPLATEESELALDVTERILDNAGGEIADIRTAASGIEQDLVQLPLAVYTHSDDEALKSRSMDLFERLLLLGSRSAHQALQDYDRR